MSSAMISTTLGGRSPSAANAYDVKPARPARRITLLGKTFKVDTIGWSRRYLRTSASLVHLSRIRQRRPNVDLGQLRITLEDLLEGPPLSQQLEDVLDGEPSPLDHGFTNQDLRVHFDPVAPVHRSSLLLRVLDLLPERLGLGVLGILLEYAVERGPGGVAVALAQLVPGQLDLQVVGLLGLQLQCGLVFLDRLAELPAGGPGVGQEDVDGRVIDVDVQALVGPFLGRRGVSLGQVAFGQRLAD